MNFEVLPMEQPQEKPKKVKIAIPGGGEATLSPEEAKKHEDFEKRRLMLERNEKQEAIELTTEETSEEFSPEDEEILKEVVPDAKTRGNLSPEVARYLINTKKEEKGSGERKAAA
ncbi:MAG TPA: hypothetical protein VNK70_00305 [Candidatus Paceibacterota bacterium]|nr:hypothetical protein [Candidatus Paceibacterota bacterium]